MDIDWKPKAWVAILLGIFTQSFAFLYLNQLKQFWLYTALMCLIGIISSYVGVPLGILLSIVCPIHAYIAANNYDSSRQRRWFSRWWAIPAIYLFLLLPIFITRTFLYEPFSVPAASMSPTINTGNIIVVKKYGYGSYSAYGVKLFNSENDSNIDFVRAKIYAFYAPRSNIPYVKRLIGKPGDTIEIAGDKISVNGLPLESQEISTQDKFSIREETTGNITYRIQKSLAGQFRVNITMVVPEGNFFFLGDNRDNSADSRVWGVVPSNRFIGEVVYIWDL